MFGATTTIIKHKKYHSKVSKKDGHDNCYNIVLRYDVKGSNGFREVNPGANSTDGVKQFEFRTSESAEQEVAYVCRTV